MTLTELSNGEHDTVVYAWDVTGNVGTSGTVYFSIKQPEIFPISLIVATVVTMVVVGVILLLYLRRRRH